MLRSVLSVLQITVKPGADLAGAFADLEVFEHSRRSGGFRGGRLLRPLADGAPYLVVAQWDGPDDYLRWLDSPVRAAIGKQLERLLDGEAATGRLFEELA
jgi:heme-degrading monooxygenase HmoA